MITAKDIQEQGFEHARKGYDIEEVDIFLERVATDVDALTRQNADLRARVAELSAQLEEAEAAAAEVENTTILSSPAMTTASDEEVREYKDRITSLENQVSDLNGKLAEKNDDASAISAAIISAQKSADAIREEARVEGEKIYREAEAKARELVRDALADKQQTLNELEQLKKSRDGFRAEYQALLSKFTKQATDEFKTVPRTNGPIDDREVAAQEKAAIAELRHSAAQSAQQSMPIRDDRTATVAPVDEKSSVPRASGNSADFTAFGDTSDIDIDQID